MYTLVERVQQTTSARAKAKYVAVGDISLVHTWTAADEDLRSHSPPPPALDRKSQRAKSSSSSTEDVAPPHPKPRPRQQQQPPPQRAPQQQQQQPQRAPPLSQTVHFSSHPQQQQQRQEMVHPQESLVQLTEAQRVELLKMQSSGSLDVDAILQAVEEEDEELPLLPAKRPRCSGPPTEESGQLVHGTLQVRGDVHVSGFIFGQLATTPRAADYAEWFEWEPEHLSYDADGNVSSTPPVGSVTQLRSPAQRLTLDTSGSGPCLIVSTSPSVAAGLPVLARDADKGALVAFLGQVPVRCRGRIQCGDQLVPSGDDDGTAVALSFEDDGDLESGKRRRRLGTDALGIAMEAKERQEGEEVLLCFVRWNHAVRRELKDEIDKVVFDMHGTFLSALVYATALLAAGVLALLGTLLIFDALLGAGVHDAALRRQHRRLENAVFLLGGFALALALALYATFTTSLPRRHFFLLFWVVFVLLASFRAANSHGSLRFALAAVVHALAFCYHGLLCHTALQLRKDQTRPNSLFAHLPPRALAGLKLAAPFACILLVFLLVFLT